MSAGAFRLSLGTDLSYSYLRTPNVLESGDLAMHLEHGNFSSLAAGVGAGLSLPEKSLASGRTLGFRATLRYHRELLGKAGSYAAAFSASPDSNFRQRVDFPGKDSLYAAFGVNLKWKGFSVGADVGGEFYSGNGRELFGRMNLRWQF